MFDRGDFDDVPKSKWVRLIPYLLLILLGVGIILDGLAK